MVVSATGRPRRTVEVVGQRTCARPCTFQHPCRILLGYPQSDEREVKDMRAAKVMQSGAGEETET